MTFNLPPINNTKSVSHDTQISPSVKEKSKKDIKDIDETIEQSTRDRIPPKSEPLKNEGWGFWSWLGFGKKETLTQEEEKTDEKGSSLMKGEDLAEDLEDLQHEEVMTGKTPESVEVEQSLVQEDLSLVISKKEKLEEVKEKLEDSTVKTYQAAQQTWGQRIGGGLLNAGLKLGGLKVFGHNIIGTIANRYDKFDKDRVILAQKAEMRAQLNDPQFMEFYEVVSTALIPIIKEQIDSLATKKDSTSQVLLSQETLILKLIEVILARGFANLARNVRENANDIPDFGKQPSLVSVMSLLCQKAGAHIDQTRIEGLEKKYQKDQADLRMHLDKLFPGIEDRPDEKNSLQLYIKEYIKTTDKNRKAAIKKDLFPNLGNIQDQKAKDIQAFFTTLDNLHLKSQETHQLFSQVSEDILLCLFPNKFADIEELKGWGLWIIEKTAFDFNSLKEIVANLLQDSYEPLENNMIRNEAWERDLTARLGAPDLEPVVQAPSALLVAFAKNYIQSDPSIMETTVRLIDSIVHPSAAIPVKAHAKRIKEQLTDPIHQQDKALIEALETELDKIGQKNQDLRALRDKQRDLQQFKAPEARVHLDQLNQEIDELINLQKSRIERRKNTLNQLSQQQLAHWIVETVQTMLNTEDSHLLGLGQFAKQTLNNLTLALMTQGAKLVIPKGEQIEPNAFIKEFSERLIEKAGAFKGEQEIFSEDSARKYWTDFVNDLPLPPFVKQLLVPILVEKAKSLQDTVKKTAPDFQEIQKVYAEAHQKVQSYEGGVQLLAITEKVSDQIIEQVLEKNIGLVSTLGLGDTVEELFAQYLPGITFHEDLKNWFKENISTLGVTEGSQSPQSIILLKQGIQAVMLKAMVNTIEKNFQNNSKDYAAQLLKNFHSAFSKAFKGFNDAQRKQLDAALSIQSEINKKKEQLNKIQEGIAKKPDGITSAQTALLEEVITANAHYMRASAYVNSLEERREDILTSLNRRQKKKVWTADDLLAVNESLILRKSELSTYPSITEYVADLKLKINELSRLERRNTISSLQKNELEQRQMLLILIEMSPDMLKQLSEAVNIHATLQHAENELEHLDTQLKAKEDALAKYEKRNIQNLSEWNAAKSWMKRVLVGKHESNRIYQDIADLERDLDVHLSPFKVLSKELTALLGLDKKEKLDLPPFLQDTVWPLIESAQEKQITRLLFSQVAPLLISVTDVKKNKDRLQELSNDNPFLGQLIHAAAEDVISRIPDYVTSYKPFANDILVAAGVSKPTDEEVVRMEAALSHTLVELGKQGTTASMLKPLVKGLVSEAEEEALSQSIVALIPQWDDKKLPQKEILDLLKSKVTNPKEAKNLEKQAEILTKSINQFLFNRGKANLESKHLIEAYNDQVKGTQTKIAAPQIKNFEDHLQQKKLIEKIKTVVITPEEIAVALNDAIPGATDLHSLIAPQLQAVIVGQDQAFKENREVLQQFLEGTILRLFVKIAEANQSLMEDPFAVLTGKLKDLAMNSVPKDGQTTEEAARQLIDQVLTDVLSINSLEDFDSVPASLQKLAYDKVKEQAYQQLIPFVLPIIERNQNREILKNKSGSDFLGSLCEALSKDVFTFLPNTIKGDQAISNIENLFPHLDRNLQKALADEMQKLIHEDSAAYLNASSFVGTYIEGILLKVFINVAEKNPKQISQDPSIPSKDSMIVLTEKLLSITAKKYQEMKDGKSFKDVAQELNDAIMQDVLGIDSPAAFKGLPEGVQAKAYDAIKNQLGGMLVRIQESLSTLESSQQQVQRTKEAVKKFGIAENATKAYAHILSEDIANMVVASVPHVLTTISSSGKDMKGVVSVSKGVEKYLEDLARGNVQMAKVLLGYAQRSHFKQMLEDNLGLLADQDQFVDDKKKAADLLSNLLLEPLGTVMEKAINFEEQHKKQFNQKLMANLLRVGAQHLKHIHAAKQGKKDITHEDFVKAVGSELHPGVPRAPITYQKSIDAITEKIYGSLSPDQQEAWLAERANVRNLIANMVKQETKAAKVINLDDFIKDFELIHLRIVGNPLTLSQQNALKSADKDGFTLRDIIRKEAEALNLQKQAAAYGPATQAIMKMIFPNGQEDITFVPKELRGTVWNLFKDNLFPIVLPMLTELILDPATVNKMVLSSLESMNKNLSGEIVLTPPEPADLPLDELDQVSGELIAEVLKIVTLPEWAKKLVIDPKTKEISDTMKKTLGGTLRAQFTNTFIKDKLKIALESAVARDAQGKPTLSFDTRPKEVQQAAAVRQAEQMEKDMRKATREAVGVSVSYFIRKKWAEAQVRFDWLVEKVLGKVGLKVKHALDQVFRILFFKIMGAILYYPVILPLKWSVQQLAHQIFSLDENRKAILELFTKVPADQPEADLKQHAVYHEDLVLKLGEALGKTVEEFLENEPVIPMDKEDVAVIV